jgi:hypothetical protein
MLVGYLNHNSRSWGKPMPILPNQGLKSRLMKYVIALLLLAR